ncbi:hypothetical protein SNEBB_002405 [Seison nebaliae]|nr:hypothetical protein SNEBB_002405 [Seison nebaliae]
MNITYSIEDGNEKIRNKPTLSSKAFHRFDQFDKTKTGRLGCKRDSMLRNMLLQKSELAKTRNHGYPLPDKNLTYGHKNIRRDGGVPEALTFCTRSKTSYNLNDLNQNRTGINEANESKILTEFDGLVPQRPNRRSHSKSAFYARDYEKLNKDAILNGLVTAKEHNRYRQLYDAERPINAKKHKNNDKSKLNNKQLQFPIDMVFGQPSKEAVPFPEIIQQKYGRDWIEKEEQNSYTKCPLHSSTNSMRNKNNSNSAIAVNHTKASFIRQHRLEVKDEELKRMKKFLNAKPSVSSFRNAGDRHRAFTAHHSDGHARLGLQHQGIYDVIRT